MDLKPAVCKICGGQIQVDITKQNGFCMHCGSSIIVSDVIQKVTINRETELTNLIENANRALEAEDFNSANIFVKKALEIEFNNFELKMIDLRSWIGKITNNQIIFLKNKIPYFLSNLKTNSNLDINESWAQFIYEIIQKSYEFKSSLQQVLKACILPIQYAQVLGIISNFLFDFLIVLIHEFLRQKSLWIILPNLYFLKSHWFHTFELLVEQKSMSNFNKNILVQKEMKQIMEKFMTLKGFFNIHDELKKLYDEFEVNLKKLS